MSGPTPEQQDAYLGKFRALMDADPDQPWAVQAVFGHDGPESTFAYTVGLTALGLPSSCSQATSACESP